MEYDSHIWGGSIHTALVNSLALTNSLQSLSARRIVASLYLYYRYYNWHCSSELSRGIPPPLRRDRATRLSTQSHSFSVQLFYPRLNRYAQSYMYSTGKVWNTLPSNIFPISWLTHLQTPFLGTCRPLIWPGSRFTPFSGGNLVGLWPLLTKGKIKI